MSDYLRPEYTPLFTQVQDFIADQLNTDPQLSALGIEFLPEHRLDIEYEIKNNLGKQGTVGIVNTLKGTYGGHNGSTNAWEIEAEVDVLENPPVRRAQMKKMGLSAGSTADILDWVQESLCAPSSPTYGKFCAVSQELGEDRGIIVGRSIMKTFAIADVSAVVSGEHQWVCPYALLSDLSALSGQVDELELELDNKRDKVDLSVYGYGAWSVSEYGWNGYDPMTYDPPIQMEYREIVIDTIGYIWLWITTSETQPDTYFAITPDSTQAYELISIGDEFSIITTYTPVLNETQTQITGFVGNDTPCAASRQIVSQIGDRLAKMSDLSSVSSISPYIEDANGNTISADLSCVENHPDMWQLNTGLYGSKILTQVSLDRWEYTEGDNRFVIYIDGTDTWTIEYQQNTGLDWLTIASGTDQSAPRTANSITVEMTGDFSDTWTATRPVSYLRKIATEDWVDEQGFITSADVEVSYIDDGIHKLEADLDYTTTDYTAPWEWGFAGYLTLLNWDSTNNRWDGNDGETRVVLWWDANQSKWGSEIYAKEGGVWQLQDTDYYTGTIDDTTIADLWGMPATRTLTTTDKIATESFVIAQIGQVLSAQF